MPSFTILMTSPEPLTPPSSNAPTTLSFQCHNCGIGLAVPVALAGTSGPCPSCNQTITAPAALPTISLNSKAEHQENTTPSPVQAPTPASHQNPSNSNTLHAPQGRTTVPPPLSQGIHPRAPEPFPPPLPPNAPPVRVPLPAPPENSISDASLPPPAPPFSSTATPIQFPPPLPPPIPQDTQSDGEKEPPAAELEITYVAPADQLLIPQRKPQKDSFPWSALSGLFMGIVGTLAVGFTIWTAAWKFGYGPQPSVQSAKDLFQGLFKPTPAEPTENTVRIEDWNLSIPVPSDHWNVVHPGARNIVCSMINLKDPDCKVVFQAHVLGVVPSEGIMSKDSGSGESISEMFLARWLALEAANGGLAVEEKSIGGKKFRYMREDKALSHKLFRPNPTVNCAYLWMENGTAYIFEFVATGKNAYDQLPSLAETMLADVKPLVKDLKLTTVNTLTHSAPALLEAETGVNFPSLGPEWRIIPDEPTPFAQIKAGALRRILATNYGQAGERKLSAGAKGSPSCGYFTDDGDVAGFSVFHLPPEFQPEPAHLADLIMSAWFPDTSIDRQLEKPCSFGEFKGTEFTGQLSSQLTPAPFTFRLMRRGEMVYALGAFSFSQKRASAELVSLINKVTWNEPTLDLTQVSKHHTPNVSSSIREEIILKLGNEFQQANRIREMADIYRHAYDTEANGNILVAYCEALVLLNQKEKAIEFMEKEWKIPERKRFLPEAATFLARQGKLSTATLIFITALNSSKTEIPILNRQQVETYLAELHNNKASGEDLRVLDVLQSRIGGFEWNLWESYILNNNPATKTRSIDIMMGLIASSRTNRDLGRNIITFLKQHSAHQIGLDAAMAVLRLDPHDGMAWLIRATCEREMGDHQKAATTLAKAREFNPELRDIGDIVFAFTDSEGGPVLTKEGPQANPIPLPKELFRLVQNDQSAHQINTEAPYRYLHRIRSLTFDPGEPYRSTNRYSIRIQNASGMERFNILRLPFSPYERIQVNELRVRTPEGKTIAPSDMKDAFVSEDNSDGMHTGMKVLNVPVPGLSPGCTLEYTVTEESLGIVTGPLTSSFIFATEAPCALDILYLNNPVTKVDFRHSTGDKPIILPTGLVWVERDLPAISSELHQPSLEKFVPVLWTGDSKENWARVGAEYLSLIRFKLKTDDSIIRLAKEQTQHCKSDSERIAVLSAYVRNTLSYAAIEMGMRGLIPNAATESVKNRYGDCKDHSVLLYQLLNAVGIKARLVLANSNTTVLPDLPSRGAFNHMINAVPGATKGTWDFIDCTNKFMAPSPTIPPWMLADKYVLVLGEGTSDFHADASRLIRINKFPENFENITIDRTAQVSEGRHLNVKESITLTGTSACEFRYLASKVSNKKDMTTGLKNIFNMDRNRFQVRVANLENVEAVEKPLIIQLDYEMRNVCSPAEGGIAVQLPNFTENYFLDPDTIGSNRATPFEFETPLNLLSTTQVSGPEGAVLSPTPPASAKKNFVTWKTSLNDADTRSAITLRLTRLPGSFEASEYAEFQNQISEATQSIEQVLLFHSSKRQVPITGTIKR